MISGRGAHDGAAADDDVETLGHRSTVAGLPPDEASSSEDRSNAATNFDEARFTPPLPLAGQGGGEGKPRRFPT
jgi:hypothetical protein